MLWNYPLFFKCTNSLISRKMSENVKSEASKSISFMEREDWLVLLTGGLVSSGAIGWIVYRDFNSPQLNSKAIMTILASFAGGMGIYFTGSALVSKWLKPRGTHEQTFRNDPLDLSALDGECSTCEMFANLVIELERHFPSEACKNKGSEGLGKETLSSIIQEVAEVPCRLEARNNRLNFKSKRFNTGLKLRIDSQIETYSNEGIGGRKARFKEEILSYIKELEGYVQGAIGRLPLARNIQVQSTGMSDEICQQVVMVVQEYANNMVPKFEQVTDEFVDSICKTVNVPDYDKKHKVKKAFETLGASEKDPSTAHLKIEMDQYYNALENSTKSKSPTLSCQSGQRPKIALGANMQPLNSVSSPSLYGKKTLEHNSECSLPVMSKLASPTSTSNPFKSKETSKFGHLVVEKSKISSSDTPVKLSLNQEQMTFLNILKSEI